MQRRPGESEKMPSRIVTLFDFTLRSRYMTLHIALLFAFLAIVAFAVGCLGVSATQPSVHAEPTAAEIGSAVKKPTSSWDLSLAIALRFGYSMSI